MKWIIIAHKGKTEWMFSVIAHTREAARTLAKQHMNTGWTIARMWRA